MKHKKWKPLKKPISLEEEKETAEKLYLEAIKEIPLNFFKIGNAMLRLNIIDMRLIKENRRDLL